MIIMDTTLRDRGWSAQDAASGGHRPAATGVPACDFQSRRQAGRRAPGHN